MSINEKQKPVSDKYRDNYDAIFKPKVRKGKTALPSVAHRDRTKYDRNLWNRGEVDDS